jgi:putative endonuclease
MDTKKDTTTKKGKQFEQKAVDFLKFNGFTIIETNYYAKKIGEIDIIAQKEDIYHFVEVKSGESFEAIYNITHSKLNKLIRSINYYLQVKKLDVSFCIDAIIFDKNELEFLENITL